MSSSRSILRSLPRHQCLHASSPRSVPSMSIASRSRPFSSTPPAARGLKKKNNGPEHDAYSVDNPTFRDLIGDAAAVRSPTKDFHKVPMVTAEMLKNETQPPTNVKMLVRDFIDDSLYNPNYGYFSKQAVIFSPEQPFDFNRIKDDLDFQRVMGERYAEFESLVDEDGLITQRQVWHTPTELFKPYYGEAIARYIVAQYKLEHYPYRDLIIYEIGGGNGTLMMNILDYIRDQEPDVYARTRYRIIEISSQLAEQQSQSLLTTTASVHGHDNCVEIINKSIFDWDTDVGDPCFFVATEVFDNFAHDLIRYDLTTEKAVQGVVMIDADGDFHEFYQPVLDPLAKRYLDLRDKFAKRSYEKQHPLRRQPRFFRRLKNALPFSANLSEAEYIPTKLLLLIDVLRKHFPEHHLIASDFSSLPDAIKGVNAPVVQTRYKGQMVPCSTYMVHQGYFDIFFPTNFEVFRDIYHGLANSTGMFTPRHSLAGLGGGGGASKRVKVVNHRDFVESWADLDATRTKSGDNPMSSFYQNFRMVIPSTGSIN
ncbi:hypothetical protein YB2330_004718 [Saitoella coloradoensis]